ncbi:MAG: 30S ribosomal protein S6 [Chloroflexi bacterium GWB2_49_20]|nr:MAG: 30S ribosomal protein S6 [Chloroflexi bacterium GWB2_49_20]OGN78265.1 MAG: 30S ribosomal protein S6 [Chloroflexi bacterium GWC2_49_37]OGN85301.1 MAG: 30S ribosomal protein S6 [Chloroflexi bacterium GWD2_49_16]
MHKYELVCIIHPDLDEVAFNDSVEKIQGWIKELNGEVEKTDVWGRRRLAYPIKKQREGQYVLFTTSLPPTSVVGLEQNLRFLEPLMRHMITAVD